MVVTRTHPGLWSVVGYLLIWFRIRTLHFVNGISYNGDLSAKLDCVSARNGSIEIVCTGPATIHIRCVFGGFSQQERPLQACSHPPCAFSLADHQETFYNRVVASCQRKVHCAVTGIPTWPIPDGIKCSSRVSNITTVYYSCQQTPSSTDNLEIITESITNGSSQPPISPINGTYASERDIEIDKSQTYIVISVVLLAGLLITLVLSVVCLACRQQRRMTDVLAMFRGRSLLVPPESVSLGRGSRRHGWVGGGLEQLLRRYNSVIVTDLSPGDTETVEQSSAPGNTRSVEGETLARDTTDSSRTSENGTLELTRQNRQSPSEIEMFDNIHYHSELADPYSID